MQVSVSTSVKFFLTLMSNQQESLWKLLPGFHSSCWNRWMSHVWGIVAEWKVTNYFQGSKNFCS